MTSPYENKPVSEWQQVTDQLIADHPLSEQEIEQTVLQSWNDIFNSKIGSFSIGKEIFPSPQIMSFFLHQLVAHYFSLAHKDEFKVGVSKNEKDICYLNDDKFSIEIKASSNKSKIFGNRSYAQQDSGKGHKSKSGYFITVNFEPFKKEQTQRPEICLIRFGYLEHSDWVAQRAATGQQASLKKDAYQHKLRTIYRRTDNQLK